MSLEVNKIIQLQNAAQNNIATGGIKTGGNESVFDTAKNKNISSADEKKEIEKAENIKKLMNYEKGLADKTNLKAENKQASEIEKALQNSKIPMMSAIGSFIKNEIQNISDQLSKYLEQISTINIEGLTQKEVEAKVAEISKEAQNKAAIAKVYVSRGLRAIELNKSLEKFVAKGGDIKQLKLDKIFDEIRKPAQISETNSSSSSSEESQETPGSKMSSAENSQDSTASLIKDDKITQAMKELEKYFNDGAKAEDKSSILSDYLTEGDNSENDKKSYATSSFGSNTFSNDENMKKKNPFLS